MKKNVLPFIIGSALLHGLVVVVAVYMFLPSWKGSGGGSFVATDVYITASLPSSGASGGSAALSAKAVSAPDVMPASLSFEKSNAKPLLEVAAINKAKTIDLNLKAESKNAVKTEEVLRDGFAKASGAAASPATLVKTGAETGTDFFASDSGQGQGQGNTGIISANGSGAGGKGARAGRGGVFAGAGSAGETYVTRIVSLIRANIYYPLPARRSSIEGRVITSFFVNTDGTVSNITVKRSSGHAMLDRAAIKIIQKSIPLPFPPESGYSVDVPLVFSLNNLTG